MAKLSWEWGDKDDQIIIRKPKGKLSVEEIAEFMSSHEMIMAFGEGALCVIAFRTKTDYYPGFEMEELKGDAQDLYVLTDESTCFCGKVLNMQYCPECGHKLIGGENK